MGFIRDTSATGIFLQETRYEIAYRRTTSTCVRIRNDEAVLQESKKRVSVLVRRKLAHFYNFLKFWTTRFLNVLPINIVNIHFTLWSSRSHPNFMIFNQVIKMLNKSPANILETGTSAWGTDSTRLWDQYIVRYGGFFSSVDIRPQASQRLVNQKSEHTILHVGDSVEFLRTYSGPKLDFVYLDSWDVDAMDPLPSAKHALLEFQACRSVMNPGCLILIDDTPRKGWNLVYDLDGEHGARSEENLGKGSLILREIANSSEFKVLQHEYALLLRFQ